MIGVADPGRARLIADTLALLGAERALVVHAPAGLDEIAPPGMGDTDVYEVTRGTVARWTLEVGRFGLPAGDASQLAGGTPEDNARIVTAVLSGEDRSVRRSAVAINAAAALIAGGVVERWEEAVERAGQSLDSGAAAAVLERLRRERRG